MFKAAVFVLAVIAAVSGAVTAMATPVICVGGQIQVSDTTVVANQTIIVTGQYFVEDCVPEAMPMRDIALVLEQGDRQWHLASVDADDAYTFSTQVTIPADAAVGTARLKSESSTQPLPLGFQDLTIEASLPQTGAPLVLLVALAAGLAGAGLLLRRIKPPPGLGCVLPRM